MTDNNQNQPVKPTQPANSDNATEHPAHTGWTPLGAPPKGEECPNCCGGGCTACGGTGWY